VPPLLKARERVPSKDYLLWNSVRTQAPHLPTYESEQKEKKQNVLCVNVCARSLRIIPLSLLLKFQALPTKRDKCVKLVVAGRLLPFVRATSRPRVRNVFYPGPKVYFGGTNLMADYYARQHAGNGLRASGPQSSKLIPTMVANCTVYS
jgi:hypothetical protein